MRRIRAGLILLVVAVCASAAQAQDKYPSKPIKIVLAYGAGSATDIITRIMCEQLRQSLGQSCVVENKPGAFGIVAIEEMATARNFPPKTMAELVAYAKARPGQLKYATPGAGSFPHYDMEILAQRAGV